MFNRRGFLAAGTAGLFVAGSARASKSDAIVSQITIDQQRLWIAGSIAGAQPGLFVVDTGAAFNMLRPDIAARLRLRVAGNQRVSGVGKHMESGAVVGAHNVLLGGGLRQSVVDFHVRDLADLMPDDAMGVLCAGLVTSRDSDLDFDRNELRVWPRGRADRTGFALVPSLFTGSGHPTEADRIVVTAFINGIGYRLLVDTGAPGNVLLFSDAARRSGLFSDDRPFSPIQPSGIGGTTGKLGRAVRAEQFQLGPVTMIRPIINVMDPDAHHRDGDHDGLLGLSFLQLLNLSTDVRLSKLYIQRNSRPGQPQRYRASGLWLDRDGETTRVTVVGTGSPAAQAGIKAGDEIASPAGFAEALRLADAAPGQTVSFGIRRNGEVATRSFTVHPYL